jgi:hypothetical protein
MMSAKIWCRPRPRGLRGGVVCPALLLVLSILAGCSGGSDAPAAECAGTVTAPADTWASQTLAAMPTARHSIATAVVGCTVYTFGGRDVTRTILDTVEAFDPTANGGLGAWSAKTPLTSPRHGIAAAVVDGIVYLLGGNGGTDLQTVEAFDPAGNGGMGSWSARTDMPTARSRAASAVVNGIVYVIGGNGGNTTVEAFDPAGNTGLGAWSPKTDMTNGRTELTAQAVGGIVYAIGGMSSCPGLDTVEDFDPAGGGGAGAWSSKTVMPTARKGLTSVQVGGQIYVFGGIDSCDGGTLLQTVESFDPAGSGGAGAWTALADMPTARQNLGTAAVAGIVFAVGGNTDTGSPAPIGTVEAYAP